MSEVLANSISVHDLILLYRKAESRAARLRLLIGAGRDLAMSDRVETAATIVLRAATEFGAYDVGCVLFADDHAQSACVAASSGHAMPEAGISLPLQSRIQGVDRGVAALVHHAQQTGNEELKALLVGMAAIPFGEGDAVSGVLVLAAYGALPESDAEDRDTLRLLASMLSGIATVARHRAEQQRLNGLLEQREARLADLVGRLISVQEDERRRLSIELHDGVAQLASSAHQCLQAYFEKRGSGDAEATALFERSLGLLRRTTAEIRGIMADLRPAVLDDFGMAMAIRKELDEFEKDGISASFHNGIAALRLRPETETAFFRVCQEALRNINRHSRATRVDVEIAIEHTTLFMRIRDDGQGFDPRSDAGTRQRGERLGLLGMHERMRQIGGSSRIESSAGTGTLVEASIPLSMAKMETTNDAEH